MRKAGRKLVRAKFTRKARKRLAKARKVRFTVRVRTASGRRAATRTRRMTLAR